MKRISILLGLMAVFSLFYSCEKEMPYDLDSIQRGVLIDVTPLPGTDPFVLASPPPGREFNLGVNIQVVPEGDGPWESLDLILVYNTSEAHVYTTITELPAEISIDYDQVLSILGIENADGGDTFDFTVNVNQAGGKTIYGWSSVTGYNNTQFSGWLMDGRPYSSRVRWVAQGEFFSDIEWLNANWGGAARSTYWDVTQNAEIIILPADDVPTADFWESVNIDPAAGEEFELAGMEIQGFFLDDAGYPVRNLPSSLKLWVNPSDLQVYIPVQHLGIELNLGALLGADPWWQEMWIDDPGDFFISTSDGIIEFSGAMEIGDSGYWFGYVSIRIQSLNPYFQDEDEGIVDAGTMNKSFKVTVNNGDPLRLLKKK